MHHTYRTRLLRGGVLTGAAAGGFPTADDRATGLTLTPLGWDAGTFTIQTYAAGTAAGPIVRVEWVRPVNYLAATGEQSVTRTFPTAPVHIGTAGSEPTDGAGVTPGLDDSEATPNALSTYSVSYGYPEGAATVSAAARVPPGQAPTPSPTAVGDTSVTLNPDATGFTGCDFHAYVVSTGTDTIVGQGSNGAGGEIVVPGLTPGNTYGLYLAAVRDDVFGIPTGPVTVNTQPSGNESFNLSYGATVAAFVVAVGTGGDSVDLELYLTDGATPAPGSPANNQGQGATVTFSGLSMGTEYKYRSRTNATNGASSAWTGLTSFTTGPGLSSGTANATWDTGGGSGTISFSVGDATGGDPNTGGPPYTYAWTLPGTFGSLSQSTGDLDFSGPDPGDGTYDVYCQVSDAVGSQTSNHLSVTVTGGLVTNVS